MITKFNLFLSRLLIAKAVMWVGTFSLSSVCFVIRNFTTNLQCHSLLPASTARRAPVDVLLLLWRRRRFLNLCDVGVVINREFCLLVLHLARVIVNEDCCVCDSVVCDRAGVRPLAALFIVFQGGSSSGNLGVCRPENFWNSSLL